MSAKNIAFLCKSSDLSPTREKYLIGRVNYLSLGAQIDLSRNREMQNDSLPLVSVIIPNHNYSRYLNDAIQSVLQQTYRNLEIIVVDDGSTDSSTNVVESFGNRVKLIEQVQSGVSVARNTGFAASTGDLICFLDSDDAWLPNKLESQARVMLDKSVSLVYSSVLYCDEKLNIISKEQARHRGNCHGEYLENPTSAVILLGCSNAMIRRHVVHEVGGFNPTLSTSADWDFFRRISKISFVEFELEPQILYRRHRGSMSASSLRTYYSDNEKAFKIVVDELKSDDKSVGGRRISGRMAVKFYSGAFKAMFKSGDVLGAFLQIRNLIKTLVQLLLPNSL